MLKILEFLEILAPKSYLHLGILPTKIFEKKMTNPKIDSTLKKKAKMLQTHWNTPI
jgi:hypothetical protein